MLYERVHPILLLEDDSDDASFVRRALTKARITNELNVCRTVQEARELVELLDGDRFPALVIVDLALPGEGGLGFLKWLRQQPPPVGTIPAMIFSVSTDPAERQEASALRAVLFLQKPASEHALTHAVQALGFVVTTTVAGGESRRVIEPR